jgi:isopropylmalate/homocitrate/citramalate synthase
MRCRSGSTSMYVTEDTSRCDPETVKRLYATAINCGARAICICDTAGHATPMGALALVRFVIAEVVKPSGEKIRVDWHGHSDRGLAIANSMAAVIAGANCVHGCAIGLGERVGNTQIDQMLVNLKLMGIAPWDRQDLTKLKQYCQAVSRATGVPIPANYPVVGDDAFRTATGVHAAAIIKAYHKDDIVLANTVYSGVPSHVFGLEQIIDVGPMSGKSNVLFWLERRGIPATDDVVERIYAARQAERPHPERRRGRGVSAGGGGHKAGLNHDVRNDCKTKATCDSWSRWRRRVGWRLSGACWRVSHARREV